MEIAPSPEGERRLLFLFHHLESFIFLPLPLLRGEFSHSSSSSTPLFFFFFCRPSCFYCHRQLFYLFIFCAVLRGCCSGLLLRAWRPIFLSSSVYLFIARDALQNLIRPFVVTNGPHGTKSSYGWGEKRYKAET